LPRIPDIRVRRLPEPRFRVVRYLAFSPPLSNVFGPVRLVFSPGLTTFLDPGGSTSRDPLSRDPGTRSSAVLRSDSARFGWCFPRTSRPFSTPEGRLHGSRSRVTPLLGLLPFRERFRSASVCVLSTLLTARSAAADFPDPARAWPGTWPCPAVGDGFGSVRLGVFPDPLGQFDCRRVHGPRSHVARYLAFRRSLNGCGLVVCSPVLTASSTAVEFARPAFAFLATWPSHRSWDGAGPLRFSVGALTSTPCYGTLGCCADTVSICSMGPVVR
jgi:hypothetical protein